MTAVRLAMQRLCCRVIGKETWQGGVTMDSGSHLAGRERDAMLEKVAEQAVHHAADGCSGHDLP